MMGKIFKISGISLIVIALFTILSLLIVGYEPQDQSPGLWLTGELATEPVADWSFTEQHGEIFVQTRSPWFIPHSVTAYCATYNDSFYLFSAYYGGGDFPDLRRWNKNVVRDPRVRLKIGDQLFDQTLSYIDDESIRMPVHQAFVDKYPQWASPGLENVHIFQVL
jgi:hypothetical protein|tara:strand:- start:170 stop:664 length:495 start_codon:yes stop_codon:yes gene_type:complete